MKYKKTIFCAACILITYTGCGESVPSAPPSSRADDEATAAVRQFYAGRGITPPERIDIVNRDDKIWTLSAGPKAKENIIKYNIEKKTIVEWHPGQ